MDSSLNISEKRYDVFLSSLAEERLSFEQEDAKRVDIFLTNYVLPEIHKTWRNMGGFGHLSIFCDATDVRRHWNEAMEALLQTSGGGAVVCIITKNYFCNQRRAALLDWAFKLCSEKSSKRLHLHFTCLEQDANAVRNSEVVRKAGLGGVFIRAIRGDENGEPSLVARKIAERIAASLIDSCSVVGRSVKQSFANLLEIINSRGPDVEILANRLRLHGRFSSRLEILREAEARRIISLANVESLEEVLESDEGLRHVRSYIRKWFGAWTTKKWTTPLSESEKRSKLGKSSLKRRPPMRDLGFSASNLQVPSLPEHLTIAMEDESRPECQLKHLLVDHAEGTKASSSGGLVVGVQGFPGAGKSSICVAIAKDPEIRECFEGRVAWIQFGEDASLTDVFDYLAYVAEFLGYEKVAVGQLAPELGLNAKVERLLNMIRAVGSEKKFLMILDNVWCISVVRPFVEATGDLGCVVFTTRKLEIVREIGAQYVEVKELSNTLSLRLLERWSGGKAIPERDQRQAEHLLNLCGNLAMAVKIAGATLGRKYRNWPSVIRELENNLASLPRPSGRDVRSHESIYAMISVSYSRLSREEQEAVEAFSVICGKATLQLRTLEKILGKKAEKVEIIVERLADAGLIEYSREDGRQIVRVHDVMISFARKRCQYLTTVHERIVHNYRKELEGTSNDINEKREGDRLISKGWWNLEADGYVERNIIRHMEEIGIVEELLRTVSSQNWGKFQRRNRNLASFSDDVERAIRCALLFVIERTQPRIKWAEAQIFLGELFRIRIEGSREVNMEKSIKFFESSLEVYRRENYPKEWASTVFNIGIAYMSRLLGERAANIEQSIRNYKISLEIRTRESYREEWGDTMCAIGNAYRSRLVGNKGDNIEESIRHFKMALEVRSRDSYPVKWAQTTHNLSAAYHSRIYGNQKDNLEKSITCSEIALQVLTRESFPEDWARIMHNLGVAYEKRLAGKTEENIEESIRCFHRALEIRTQDLYPKDFAITMHSLRIAYTKRSSRN